MSTECSAEGMETCGITCGIAGMGIPMRLSERLRALTVGLSASDRQMAVMPVYTCMYVCI